MPMQNDLTPAHNAQLPPGRISPYLLGSLFYSVFWGVVGLLEPFLNIYFKQLGLSGLQIGMIISLMPLSMLVFSPFVSALADRNAWRVRILALCCLGSALGYFLLALPRAFPGILAASVLIALLRSPAGPIGDALVLRLSTHYSIDYGRMRLWGSFFYASVAIAIGFVWERSGLWWMFPAVGVGYLGVSLIALRMEEGEAVMRKTSAPWKLFLQNKVLLALFVSVLFMGASTNIFNFTGLYMAHLGGAQWLVGTLLGVTAMTEVPAMFLGGRLMRRLGGMRTLLFAFGLFAAAYLFGIAARFPWMLLVTGILNGAGFGLGFIAIVVTFDEHAPDNWSASVQAMVNAGMFGFAPFLSSFAYGAIYDAWPGGVYAFSAALIAAAILALLAALRLERDRKAAPPPAGG